jgi:hypothetical protein
MKTLVVVPCGQKKVWDDDPDAGSVAARHAYTGSPFKVNREFAERFGDNWMVLSAKYGLITPDFELPEPYNVTFKRLATNPISAADVRVQVETIGAEAYTRIIGLGGKEYRQVLSYAFEHWQDSLVFPFAGLPIGICMHETKLAIASGVIPASR